MSTTLEFIKQKVKEWNSYLQKFGLECDYFTIENYNRILKDAKFSLQANDNTICLSLLSNPDWFDLSLKKLWKNGSESMKEEMKRSPVHTSTKYFVKQFVNEQLKEFKNTEIIYDFDMVNHRPRVLVQTAGHASGQAYFYQNENHPFGCSIHKQYGGYFGFRGVIILHGCHLEEGIVANKPEEVFGGDSSKINSCLAYFNKNDNRWRDSISVSKRYSDEQLKFFSTPPKDRIL